MSSGRIRCSNSRKDFNPFINNSFSGTRISSVPWSLLIKLYELETSARKASIQLGLSYPTALKGFDILWSAFLRELSRSDEVFRGEIEADESYFRGKRNGKRGLQRFLRHLLRKEARQMIPLSLVIVIGVIKVLPGLEQPTHPFFMWIKLHRAPVPPSWLSS